MKVRIESEPPKLRYLPTRSSDTCALPRSHCAAPCMLLELLWSGIIREESGRKLDLRGDICPGPTAETLEALKTIPPGGKLAVVTDYLPARQTIPRLVEQRGCSWRMTEDDGKTFRLEIVKGGV